MLTDIALKTRLAHLVAESCEGTVSVEQAMSAEVTLRDLGVTSLAYLRLIDAVENEFGVYVDMEGDVAYLDTIAGLADYLTEQGIQVSA